MTRRRVQLFDDASPYLDRFGLLLLLTAATIVVLSLVRLQPRYVHVAGRLGEILATALVAATVILAMRASGVARRGRIVAEWLIVTGFVALAVVAVLEATVGSPSGLESEGQPFTAPVFLSLMAVISPLLVVRRVLQHRRVEQATLLGAVAAYLMIPLAFFFVFLTVDQFQSTDFFGQLEPTTTYMYFSLATVTTVGYGDFTASTELGHLASVSEAILGQVYLVTFVAMLVGLRVQAGRRDDQAIAAPSDGGRAG